MIVFTNFGIILPLLNDGFLSIPSIVNEPIFLGTILFLGVNTFSISLPCIVIIFTNFGIIFPFLKVGLRSIPSIVNELILLGTILFLFGVEIFSTSLPWIVKVLTLLITFLTLFGVIIFFLISFPVIVRLLTLLGTILFFLKLPVLTSFPIILKETTFLGIILPFLTLKLEIFLSFPVIVKELTLLGTILVFLLTKEILFSFPLIVNLLSFLIWIFPLLKEETLDDLLLSVSFPWIVNLLSLLIWILPLFDVVTDCDFILLLIVNLSCFLITFNPFFFFVIILIFLKEKSIWILSNNFFCIDNLDSFVLILRLSSSSLPNLLFLPFLYSSIYLFPLFGISSWISLCLSSDIKISPSFNSSSSSFLLYLFIFDSFK